MITLFVALYSLFSLRTAVKTSDIKELHVKTVKRGENVTMECSMSKDKNKNNLAWYRQSFGKVPQYFVRLYGQNNYNFVDEFKDSHFSMTVNDQKFDLNINGTREDDGGEYFCGEVEGIIIKFTSGTRLQFEGSNEGSKSSDGKGASNDHPNNTNQADDEDVLNYAAVSFAKKPSSSRASRDKSHEDVYAQVKIK
ncbi:novel immune-type receptor 6 isoform X7 [Ictalurus punctatus]|uniref:Novel immune-type receptor 6 isoform X7 n=1 Tax=Ictalurus punctatus TaxID=7998 RepID=A0A9F7RA01_ICTPU|nr:novel immune-type receptor 6 isoform X7 [Ictalurus punctatus]